jgi:anti-sigma factor (TIGR02949 family)
LLTCKEFLESLNDYLDELISPEERAKLEKHVNDCPNCWVVVDTTKRTLQIYKGQDPQPIPEEVKSRLMQALAKKLESGRQEK